MPRPRKWRRVCAVPQSTHFSPAQMPDEEVSAVEMTVDEYETIRLIDFEGFTQEQCTEQMEVSRTTVQAIYQSARKKLAECIVSSRPLIIGGGDYRICEHSDGHCGQGCCRRNNSMPKRLRERG